jgi:hypothetical protein
MLRGFTAVLAGLSDLGVQKCDVLAIRRMLEPYVEQIMEFLAPAPVQDKTKAAVNGEQERKNLFTVHERPERRRVRDGGAENTVRTAAPEE